MTDGTRTIAAGVDAGTECLKAVVATSVTLRKRAKCVKV